MLEFRNVTFSYGGENVIENLSFRAEKGEFVTIVGPSGCGKSTILRLANGLLKPDSGEILVDGKSVAGQKSFCGYMPQSDLMFPWRTVRDNVRLPLEVKGGMSKKEMAEKASDALKSVGLAGWEDKRPSELSGGMRQRAAFARTLMTGCDLMLLDEPFSALDYLTRLNMRSWLSEQCTGEQKTVLFITHDVEEAVFLSGRVLAVRNTPVRELESIEVPAPFPRTRETMQSAAMGLLVQKIIDMLTGREEK